ncbi:hypothetical protein Tco_0930532 [Tanacetum coccineum]
MESSFSNSDERDLQQLQERMTKTRKDCSVYFELIKKHLKYLLTIRWNGWGAEARFNRAIQRYFGEKRDTFNLSYNIDNLQRQIEKEYLHEGESRKHFTVLRTQYKTFFALKQVDSPYHKDQVEDQVLKESFKKYTGKELQTYRRELIYCNTLIKSHQRSGIPHWDSRGEWVCEGIIALDVGLDIETKELTPSLYNIDEMGKDLLSDQKIISEEELKCEAEKRLKVIQRKSLLSYHGFVYGDTQFEEPPKVPLKKREVNLKKHLEQAQLNHEGDVLRKVQNRLSKEFELLARDINHQLRSFEKCLVKEMKDDLKYVMSLEDEFDEKCLILDIQTVLFKTSSSQPYQSHIAMWQHGQILKETSNEAKLKTDIHVIESINIELECKVAKLLEENKHLKAQIQEKVFAHAALQNELRKSKGNSVDTKFAKPSILGKPPLQQLKNQSVVRQPNAFKSERPKCSTQRFASQVDVINDLSKPVTPHHWPKARELALAKPHHVIAPSKTRNNSKNMPRFSSYDMVHNHYLEEAKKKTQEKDRNSKTSMMPSARLPTTANGSKPKPRSTNQMTRNWPTYKSSYVTKTNVPKAEHSRNSSSFSDSKCFVCLTCQKYVFNANHDAFITKLLKRVNSRIKVQPHKTTKRYIPIAKKNESKKPERWIPRGQKFFPNKTFAVYVKTMPPRSGLTWKPTGIIFTSIGLRWIPTG